MLLALGDLDVLVGHRDRLELLALGGLDRLLLLALRDLDGLGLVHARDLDARAASICFSCASRIFCALMTAIRACCSASASACCRSSASIVWRVSTSFFLRACSPARSSSLRDVACSCVMAAMVRFPWASNTLSSRRFCSAVWSSLEMVATSSVRPLWAKSGVTMSVTCLTNSSRWVVSSSSVFVAATVRSAEMSLSSTSLGRRVSGR